MYKYETHMHTGESSICAKATKVESKLKEGRSVSTKAAKQVRCYKELGYAGIIVTDHLSGKYLALQAALRLKQPTWEEKVEILVKGYLAAKEEGDKCGLDVFLGWEISLGDLHFLTYGLDMDFLRKNENINRMSIEEYSKLVRGNGGYIAQAHPYMVKMESSHARLSRIFWTGLKFIMLKENPMKTFKRINLPVSMAWQCRVVLIHMSLRDIVTAGLYWTRRQLAYRISLKLSNLAVLVLSGLNRALAVMRTSL